MSPLQTTAVIVITALAFGAAVRVIVAIGFYLLAAYIVHKTGKTSDVAAIGRAVGALVAVRGLHTSATAGSRGTVHRGG